jgi:hypothetical protein
MKKLGFGTITTQLFGDGIEDPNLIIELPANKYRGRITGITAGFFMRLNLAGISAGFAKRPFYSRLLVVETIGIDDKQYYDPENVTITGILKNVNIVFDYFITFSLEDFNSVNIELPSGIALNENQGYSVILFYPKSNAITQEIETVFPSSQVINSYMGFYFPEPLPFIASLSVRGTYESLKNPFGELR